jgi:hypothetical protein
MGFSLKMTENIDRPTDSEVGREVVSGLERTLAWIKSQFNVFRADVEVEHTEKTLSVGASSDWTN